MSQGPLPQAACLLNIPFKDLRDEQGLLMARQCDVDPDTLLAEAAAGCVPIKPVSSAEDLEVLEIGKVCLPLLELLQKDLNMVSCGVAEGPKGGESWWLQRDQKVVSRGGCRGAKRW
jgi:hypothetical protein